MRRSLATLWLGLALGGAGLSACGGNGSTGGDTDGSDDNLPADAGVGCTTTAPRMGATQLIIGPG